MQKVPRPLLVMHPNRALRDRIRAVARSQRLELQMMLDWAELHEEVPGAPASAIIVVDPYADSDGDAPSPELGSLLNHFPSLTVAAAFAVRPGQVEHMQQLADWGVVQVIDLAEETTVNAIAQRLLEARGRSLRALVESSLPADTSPAARSILSAAAAIVAEGGQGQDLAEAMNITPRTLSRWCRRAGLPPPKRLLAWMRILLAAEFLDDPGRPVAAVARACGYAADSSLRLALRRFTGRNPTELREEGAFAIASEKFVEELQRAKAPKRRYRARSRSATNKGSNAP